MAFTGTATVTPISKTINKISDVSLAGGATGTISNNGGGGDATLPANAAAINDNTKVTIMCDNKCYASINTGVITITNSDGSNASNSLVIFIENLFFRTGK